MPNSTNVFDKLEYACPNLQMTQARTLFVRYRLYILRFLQRVFKFYSQRSLTAVSTSWVLDKSLFLLYCCAFLKVGNVEEDRACFVLVMHKLPFCVNCRDLQTPCRIFKARFCHSILHEQMKGIDKESFMRVHWLIMFCQKFREPWLSTCFALVMFLELKIQ